MTRYLYIVSRDHPDFFEALHERFADDPKAEVIMDRRWMADPPSRRRPGPERRSRPDIDQELRRRFYAIVVVAECRDP